jgi:hypothetical protein
MTRHLDTSAIISYADFAFFAATLLHYFDAAADDISGCRHASMPP